MCAQMYTSISIVENTQLFKTEMSEVKKDKKVRSTEILHIAMEVHG